MLVFDNPYQVHQEPSIQSTWYSPDVHTIESSRVFNTTNRYKNKKVLTLTDGTTFLEFIRRDMIYTPVRDTDQYYFVMSNKSQRPDIVSLDLLGISTFYWVILSNNNLVSPLQMKPQLTLRVPTITTVMGNTKLI